MKRFFIVKSKVMFVALLMASTLFVGCSDDDDDDSDEYGDWVEKSTFNGDARGNAASFVIGDKGYVIGGYNDDTSDFYSDAWVYDSENNFWESVTDFPGVARSGAVAFAVDGKGYVGTGIDEDGNLLQDFYVFDPTAAEGSEWSQIADFTNGRSRAIGFSVNGLGYVGTGNDGSNQKDFWEYDPATDVWTEINGYGGDKRRDATVFVIDDVAYIGSGYNNGYLEDFYSFDGSSWIELTDIDDDADDDDDVSVLVSNSVGFAINGKGYYATGETGAVSSSVWEYTPSSDTWEQLGDFEGISREGASAFSFVDSGFVFGGYANTSNYFDDMYELFPETLQD